MAKSAKAIFFDLGETLVTHNIENRMVTRNALSQIGKLLPKPVSPKMLFKIYTEGYRINDGVRSEYNVEIPIQIWMRQLLRRVTATEPPQELVDNCKRTIVDARADSAVAFKNAHETLRKLSKRGMKLGIMSNVSSHEVALEILSKVRMVSYFDLVVTSAMIGIRKPDPGIFQYALYKLNITPREAVIVGDSERHDIQGGYAAGFRTVLVNRKKPTEDSLADYRFRSLAEAETTLRSL